METDRVMPQSREEFLSLFERLTGQANHNEMMTSFQGHRIFAWFPLFWHKVYNFPIQPKDIIVATFPKSGTTWLQHMVFLIATEDFETGSKVPVDIRAPFLEFPRPLSHSTYDELASRPTPRVMKTHLPPCLLPRDAPKCNVIYAYRDAKDVVVSFYYHYRATEPRGQPFKRTFEEFARDFMKGNVAFGPYPRHLQSYLEYKKAGNRVLLLRYEDMKKDTRSAIRRIAGFIGKTLTDEMVERIYEETTVEAMRSNRATNYSAMENFDQWKGGQFIRKGIVGDWRNHFTNPDLLEEFEHFITENVPPELLNNDCNNYLTALSPALAE